MIKVVANGLSCFLSQEQEPTANVALKKSAQSLWQWHSGRAASPKPRNRLLDIIIIPFKTCRSSNGWTDLAEILCSTVRLFNISHSRPLFWIRFELQFFLMFNVRNVKKGQRKEGVSQPDSITVLIRKIPDAEQDQIDDVCNEKSQYSNLAHSDRMPSLYHLRYHLCHPFECPSSESQFVNGILI